jgi:hypothetical protein
VAIDGDTIVVGAYRKGDYTGAVYVFRTTDGGATYSQVAKLTASDAEEDDGFGYSVAIDGNTVVVGANKYDNSGSGAAYVFRTSDGGASYDQVAKLTGDVYFGQSVAIAGGTVVIGAPFESGAGTYSGAAFVFRTTDSGATYNQVANVTAADAASGDYFGWSVAIDGNTVVVGTFEGEAAYVFRTTDGSAAYGQVAKLTASDAASNDEFGISVAISGDTVVVGARANTNYGGSGWGSAYVFRTTDGGATYDEVTKLTASGAASGDNDFGCSVAIDGDTVAIGARYDDNLGSYSDSGSVYVSWPPAPTVQPTPRPTFQPTTPQPTMSPKPTPQPTLPQPTPQPTTPQPSTASLGSDSATRACGKLATALLAFTATALAL